MSIMNPLDLLRQATQLPAAIEGKLPAGAPKLSGMLTNVANGLPKLPNLPVAMPDLPTPPTLPGAPSVVTAGLQPISPARVTPIGPQVPLVQPVGQQSGRGSL